MPKAEKTRAEKTRAQKRAAERPGPKQARRDPRVAGTRLALSAALMELLNEGPIERITILALTSRAGIGYATFFRHYPDIDALLVDLSHALIDDLSALLPASLAEASPAAIAATIVRFVDERRLILRPLFVGASTAVQREIMSRAMATARLSHHRDDLSVPQALAITHSVSATLDVLTWWLREGESYSSEQVAVFLYRLALAPLAVVDST
jgi:AcrR family transcriptional regulator